MTHMVEHLGELGMVLAALIILTMAGFEAFEELRSHKAELTRLWKRHTVHRSRKLRLV
jgi:hypothetical protein